MRALSLAFLAVAVLAAPSLASSVAGRDLLQTPTDCARSVPNCNTCEWCGE